MSGRRKYTLLILIALVVIGGGYFWYARQSQRKPSVRYETVPVEQGRIVAKVTATGTLSALVTVQVGSQVSGRVQQLFVDYNSPVKKGQLIAKIDPQLFDAAVEQARANHVAAQGNLTKAKAQAVDAARQYQRARALGERQLVAQADVDTAQTNADVADAQIEAAKGSVAQAQASLHQAEVNLAYTNIISPTNGVVISRSVDVGQTVAASLQAPILFLIAEDLSKMQVDTSVAEADIGKLKAGLTAAFTVDAYTGERFTGTIRQIRNAPQMVQNVVTYDAVLDVENPELKLRPGMTANVTFVYAERDEVLRVPNTALRFRPPPELLAQIRQERGNHLRERHTGTTDGRRNDGAQPVSASQPPSESDDATRRTVWVLRGDTPKMVRIRTGLSDGTVTEVVEGDLHPGDRIITEALGAITASSSGRAGGGMGGMGGGGFRRFF